MVKAYCMYATGTSLIVKAALEHEMMGDTFLHGPASL